MPACGNLPSWAMSAKPRSGRWCATRPVATGRRTWPRARTPGYSVRIGGIECVVVSDGGFLGEPSMPFANVDMAELEPLLAGRLDEEGRLRTPYNCLLLRVGGRIALVDTGLGQYAAAVGAPAGALPAALGAEGVAPGDVEVVVLTHAHPDHIGGATAAGGLAYPRARHYLAAAERDFWLSSASDGQPEFLRGPPREQIAALERAECLELLDGEREILPGVRVEPAPGHTPGHCVVALESDAQRALFLADAVLHELNFEHLDWLGAIDVDGPRTVETRRRLLDRAAREEILVIGFHLEHPGRVERSGAAYRLRPVVES